jgi:ABC-2 type transport system permease protein
MFKVLLRSRLAALRSWLNGSSRNKKRASAGKTVLFALLMLYAAGCVGFMMFGVFSQIAGPFAAAGLSWLYFTMYGLMDLSLMVIGSVFMAKSQLYEARDNDLLMSMPIRPSDILASRMAMLFVINLGMGLLVCLPAALAWSISGPGLSGAGWACFVLLSLFLAFLALAISCLLGWLLSAVTARVRNRTMMDTAVSLAFLLAYFYFISKMNTAVAALAASGASLAGKLGAVAPLYWLGAAMSDGNLAYFAFLTAICLVPFALAYWLLSATFIRTATQKRGFAKIKYVDRGQKASSVNAALYRRELSRFTSSSGYLINAGLGAVFMVAAAVLLALKRGTLLAAFSATPELADYAAPLMPLAVCLMAGMTTISAPSVSIEGRTLWISQSLPLPPQDILKAKLKLHLSIVMPATVVDIIVILAVFRTSGPMLAVTVLLPLIFSVFAAVLGLMANLRHPYFDWVNETQAVKSGASVMIAMFGSWGMVALPSVLLFALPELLPPEAVMCIFTLLTAALTAAMYRWIMTRGAKIYSEL